MRLTGKISIRRFWLTLTISMFIELVAAALDPEIALTKLYPEIIHKIFLSVLTICRLTLRRLNLCRWTLFR